MSRTIPRSVAWGGRRLVLPLFLATTVLYATTFSRPTIVQFNGHGVGSAWVMDVVCADGAISWVHRRLTPKDWDYQSWNTTPPRLWAGRFLSPFFHGNVYGLVDYADPPSTPAHWLGFYALSRKGNGHRTFFTGPMPWVPVCTEVSGATVPFWPLLVLTGLFPLKCAVRAFHMRRRKRLGFCSVCGYDLRASPSRCPECGTLAAAG